MINRVILIGNLARNIELRYTTSGVGVARTAIATNRRWKDKTTGDQKEEVMFIDITIFGRMAEVSNQYLRKGSKVFIEGRLQLDRWTDQNGQNRSKHLVVAETVQFLDAKNSNPSNAPSNDYQDNYAPKDDFHGNNYAPKDDYAQKNDFQSDSYAPKDIDTDPIDDSDLPF